MSCQGTVSGGWHDGVQRTTGDAHSREDDVTERLYDLREEPWIPFRRRSGVVEWGAPWLLTDRLEADPIVALAAPRPDFNGALHEFLIGLVSVAMQARDEEEWREWWKAPPAPEQLRERLMALPPAFYLNGDGPRFMQDLQVADFADEEDLPIEQLLIETGSGKEVFVKRGRYPAFGAEATAMALIALQTYSPEGGRGHLTGMRGGGPLTTIVIPQSRQANGDDVGLWHTSWANADTVRDLDRRSLERARLSASDTFPWLSTTRKAGPKGAHAVTPSDANPAQCYFPMPRRLRIYFHAAGVCDVIGRSSVMRATHFRRRPLGVKYRAWIHPLSPYQRIDSDPAPQARKGKAEGVGWRDWLSLTVASPQDAKRFPAWTVSRFQERNVSIATSRLFVVRAFGFEMESAKARYWVDAALPCIATDKEHTLQLLRDTATRLVSGTQLASGLLASAVEHALFPNPKEAPGDRAPVKAALWGAMEQPFYQVMFDVVANGAEVSEVDSACAAFRARLESAALDGFDEQVSTVQLLSSHVRRAVAARYGLRSALRGYGKMGNKLFNELRLPAPESAAPKTKSTSSGKKQRTRTGGKS